MEACRTDENKFATRWRGNGNRSNSQPGSQPILQILLTADQMFTPNLNDKIAQFNLVTRHLATVSRHLCAGARTAVGMPASKRFKTYNKLIILINDEN